MNETLEKELQEVIQDKKLAQSLGIKIETALFQLKEMEIKSEQLARLLRKEERALNRLENTSLASLLSTALGTKGAKLERQKKEYLAAKHEYDAHLKSTQELRAEVDQLQEQASRLDNLEERYLDLLERKEEILIQQKGKPADKILALAAQAKRLAVQENQLKEAQEAVKDTIWALNDLVQSLDSAADWGVIDMVGGGLGSTAIKHSWMNDAKKQAGIVKESLNNLRRELYDLKNSANLDVDLGNVAVFADYVWDGLLIDWFVQSKIQEAQDRVWELKDKLLDIEKYIKLQIQEVVNQKEELAEKKRLLIEQSSIVGSGSDCVSGSCSNTPYPKDRGPKHDS